MALLLQCFEFFYSFIFIFVLICSFFPPHLTFITPQHQTSLLSASHVNEIVSRSKGAVRIFFLQLKRCWLVSEKRWCKVWAASTAPHWFKACVQVFVSQVRKHSGSKELSMCVWFYLLINFLHVVKLCMHRHSRHSKWVSMCFLASKCMDAFPPGDGCWCIIHSSIFPIITAIMLACWVYEEEIRCRRKWLQGINTASDMNLWTVTGRRMTVAEDSFEEACQQQC